MRVFIVSLFLLITFSSFSQLTGKVVSIADGDTFTLLTDSKKRIRIRLYGIDCPEKAQDFGVAAKKFLSDLIFNKQVTLQEINVDQYARIIGIVAIGKVNVNEALLNAGLAWHYKVYDHNRQWALLEDKARKAKRGLWIKADATAPWKFRKLRKMNQQPA